MNILALLLATTLNYQGSASSYLNYYSPELTDNSLEYIGTVNQATFDRETRHLIADWTLSLNSTPAPLPYPDWMLQPFTLHTDVTFPALFEDYVTDPSGFTNDFPIAFSGGFSDGFTFGSGYACCAYNHISQNWSGISISGYTGVKKGGYDLEIGTYLSVSQATLAPETAAETLETPEPVSLLLLASGIGLLPFRSRQRVSGFFDGPRC